jgi:hypothetical protein
MPCTSERGEKQQEEEPDVLREWRVAMREGSRRSRGRGRGT